MRLSCALLLAGLGLACASGDPRPTSWPGADGLHVLLLNGGSSPPKNYYSHLDNLRRIVALLEARGTPPARITVFASDGPDPAPDLATRQGELPADFWLLPAGGIGRALRPPILYENSELGAYALRPATRAALEGWFESKGRRLEPGETLLLYVTDHGRREGKEPGSATISLWKETLTVDQLRQLLAGIDPGVRVVLLMSQCFSGSFAHVILAGPEEPGGDEPVPAGNVCGYFAATPTRPASGCYPEVSGKEALGHSHRVFEALARVDSLAQVQRQVLVTDRTPDVPHATTDFYLERHLRQAAVQAGMRFAAFVDQELAEARSRGGVEEDFLLLDRVAESFGFAPPRTLGELALASAALPDLSRKLLRFGNRWSRALDSLRAENLRLFVEARPDWAPRLELEAVRTLDPAGKRALADELLAELAPFTQAAPDRLVRLRSLHDKERLAREARYRTEVRVGVVLRMRMLLTRIAGEAYLARLDEAEAARAYADLSLCEDLSFAPASGSGSAGEDVVAFPIPEPFATLSQERELLESVSPSWLGVRYEGFAPDELEQAGLERGPVRVQAVLEDSPAARAGLRVDDIVLGPPGAPFEDPGSLRELVMQSPTGVPIAMHVLRGGEIQTLSLVLEPYPLVLPKIKEAGPAEQGGPARK